MASAATPVPARGPHHLPTTVARQTIQPSLPPPSPQPQPHPRAAIVRTSGNSLFRSKAAAVNFLPLRGRVACLSRPRNTSSPSCPLLTPEPLRTLRPSTPPLPHLPGLPLPPTNDTTTTSTSRNRALPPRRPPPEANPLRLHHLPIMTMNDSGANVDKSSAMTNSSSPNGSSGSPVTPPTTSTTSTTAAAADETGTRH